MIKLLGVLLVVCAGVGAGFIQPCSMNQRIRLLEQLEQDLCYMGSELNSSRMSIPELMEVMQEQCGCCTKPLYTAVRLRMAEDGAAAFEDAWKVAVKQYCSILTDGERKKLCSLGLVLGRYLLEDELTAVYDVQEYICKALTMEKEEYRNKSKVSVSLGAAFGAFLAIVLV